jgi:hypothetical protein
LLQRNAQTDAEQAFEHGHRAARMAFTLRKSAAHEAADRGPEEPCGEQNAQRDFVAVEDCHHLAHEDDLAEDGAASNQHQSRLDGCCRAFVLVIRDGVDLFSHPSAIIHPAAVECKSASLTLLTFNIAGGFEVFLPFANTRGDWLPI